MRHIRYPVSVMGAFCLGCLGRVLQPSRGAAAELDTRGGARGLPRRNARWQPQQESQQGVLQQMREAAPG